jgi:hypothetical protein
LGHGVKKNKKINKPIPHKELGDFLYMRERIQSLLPEQKKGQEYHQDTVRVALLHMDPRLTSSMLPSSQIIHDTLQALPNLHGEALTQHILIGLSSVRPEVTTMVWEVKDSGKDVVNPNQVILPGGGGAPYDPGISEKKLIETAIQETAEEVHMVAHNPFVVPDAVYTYSIDHPRLPDTKKNGRLINTSHLIVAQAAPHDQLRFFDPKDKLQGILCLTPSQVTSLLENEFIRTDEGHIFPLVDSLAIQHPQLSSKTQTDPKEAQRFKTALEDHAYMYEAKMMRNILQQLLKIPGNKIRQTERHRIQKMNSLAQPTSKREALTQLSAMTSILQNIEKSYDDRKSDPIRGMDQQTFEALIERGANENTIKKRMKLMHDLAQAARRVAQEASIDAYAKTGPQFPLLLSQLLSEKHMWDDHIYEPISKSPMLKHVVDSVLASLDIDPQAPGWHATVVNRLQALRQSRDTNLHAYKAFGDALTNRYCNPYRAAGVHAIGSIEKLGRLSEEYEELLKDITNPLEKIVNADSIFKLKPDPLGSTTQEIIELSMRMFGFSQYDGRSISPAERNAAIRKLCEMIRLDRVDRTLEKKLNSEIFTLRKAVDAIIGDPRDIISLQSGIYTVYTVPKEKIAQLAQEISLPPPLVHEVDLSAFDQTIVFGVRVKSRKSAYRKDLERGELDQENEDLSDIFGFMSALAADEFEKQLAKSHPHLHPTQKKDVIDTWKRWSSQLFLQGIIHMAKKNYSAFTPSFTLSNGRASASLQDILPIKKQQYGSASSNVKWEWIKYVLNMYDTTGKLSQVEIQHFPTIGEMDKKKVDDPLFEHTRLLTSAPTRYSIMHVYFGMQESYDDVMKSYRTQTSTIQIPTELSLVEKLIVKAHNKLGSIMTKRGIIIYTRPEDSV